MTELVFISGVQRELAAERRALRDYIRGDPLLGRYFDVFIFEDLPAVDRKPDEVYLEQLNRASVYLGLFGREYGSEDRSGVSPTEREFDRATEKRKIRLVFVKSADDRQRHPKMLVLIRKAERQLTRRRFSDTSDLTGVVYASLIGYLEQRGVLPRRPFDAAACPDATLRDISADKIAWLLRRAREERRFALEPKATPIEALTHLNLLDSGRPSHSAVLLFGTQPQRFLPAAEVKCLHYHGTEPVKPIPSYQLFKSTLFDQVDHAVDFVLSRLARSVAARHQSAQAGVKYEIPRAVVAEVIVNAIAHRDYTSAASVQVYVFADRVEVRNPGELPPALTPDHLRRTHPSIPHNPLICEALFLAHYIEKAGTGTLDVIAGCRAANLPEPDFRQDGSEFVVTLWRDWLTAGVLAGLGLSERQRQAVMFARTHRRIGNAEYQRVTGANKKTASRDLDDLVHKGVFARVGTTGRGTYYVITGTPRGRQGDKRDSGPAMLKGDIKGTKGTSGRPATPGGKSRRPSS